MTKFTSRSRARFVSIRKRRAFGPRRSWPWVKAKHAAKMWSGRLMPMHIGRFEGIRFITTPLLDQWDSLKRGGKES